MALWMHWLNVLAGWLDFLSSRVGLGEGLAIVVLTLLVRTFVLPISWSNAYRNCVRQKAKDLSRPDFWLALLAGLTTMLLMSLNPDLPEHMRLVLILVPSIVAVVVALKVASALSLYWTASNCYSSVQTAVLHRVVARRIRSGALKI